MTVAKWVITTHETGRPREVQINLYDNLPTMRGAATRHARHIGETASTFDNAEAVCHGFERIRIDADGAETSMPLAVIIRFSKTHLTAHHVFHELAHAAQHLYGIDLATGDARDHFHAGNEEFAHLASEITSAAFSVLPITSWNAGGDDAHA